MWQNQVLRSMIREFYEQHAAKGEEKSYRTVEGQELVDEAGADRGVSCDSSEDSDSNPFIEPTFTVT